MRLDMLAIARELREINKGLNWYQADCSKMRDYIYRQLHSPFKKEKIEQIMKNIDILLSCTSHNNSDWLLSFEFCYRKDFLDKIIDNLKHFRYKEDIGELFNILARIFDSSMFNDKMLRTLAQYDLDSYSANIIHSYMNNEQKLKFIKLLYMNQKPMEVTLNVTPDEQKFISEHIDFYINKSNNLLSLKRVLKGQDEALKKINEAIDNNPDLIIDSIMNDIEYLNKDDKDIRNFLALLVKDNIESEKVKYSDIKNDSRGAYSCVLTIGNKVIKIGKKRKTPKFPNNPYIVKPLMRREISTNGEPFFIEETQRVKTDIQIGEEELYALYKNFRNLGLIWTDIATRNVGMLLEDNVINWKEKIDPSDQTLSLEDYRGDRVLKKGDYVLLDADYIYKEDDPNIRYATRSLVNEFEERYQKEKLGIYKF